MLCSPFAELVVTFLQHPTNGPALDYENTEIANDENTYYYRPLDYGCLDDRTTITEGSTSRRDFGDDVVRRDGPACVVTKMEEYLCDAVHLIPHSIKGDEVRFVVGSYNHLMLLFSSTFKKWCEFVLLNMAWYCCISIH